MKWILGVLMFSSLAKAQYLTEAKHYETAPQAPQAQLSRDQFVDPDASYQSPLEAQMEEVKAKEQEQKQAEEEKKYLDTDYRFFQVANDPFDEDELDRAYKYQEAHFGERQIETPIAPQALKNADTTADVINEKIFKPTETAKAEPVKEETTKTTFTVEDRRHLISVLLAAHAETLKTCLKNPEQDLSKKKIVVAWEIDLEGSVTKANVRSSEVDKDISDCVLAEVKGWKFPDFMRNQEKTSHIEYTYRFTNPADKSVAAKTEAK